MSLKTKTKYNATPIRHQLGAGGKVERYHTRYEGGVLQIWIAFHAPNPHPEDNWIEIYLGTSPGKDFYGVSQPSGAVFVGKTENETENVRFSFGPGAESLRPGWNIFSATGF